MYVLNDGLCAVPSGFANSIRRQFKNKSFVMNNGFRFFKVEFKFKNVNNVNLTHIF
jgi:hypothetical protein